MVGYILTNTEYAKIQQWQLNRIIKYAKKLGEKLSKAENSAKAAEQKENKRIYNFVSFTNEGAK